MCDRCFRTTGTIVPIKGETGLTGTIVPINPDHSTTGNPKYVGDCVTCGYACYEGLHHICQTARRMTGTYQYGTSWTITSSTILP